MSKMPLQNDPVSDRISKAMKLKGLNAKQLSEKLGKNATYMQQFVKYGVPANLPEDVRQTASQMLGVPEDQLIRRDQVLPAPRATANGRVGSPLDLGNFGTIPVYGQAVAGSDGRYVFNGQRMDSVLAPPALRGVQEAYAVYVDGDSMYPRYRAGETVYVHPHKPVRRGDFVVVQIATADDGAPPEGYIKEFVSRDERRLRLVQLNPKKFIEFPNDRVVSVHRIVWLDHSSS